MKDDGIEKCAKKLIDYLVTSTSLFSGDVDNGLINGVASIIRRYAKPLMEEVEGLKEICEANEEQIALFHRDRNRLVNNLRVLRGELEQKDEIIKGMKYRHEMDEISHKDGMQAQNELADRVAELEAENAELNGKIDMLTINSKEATDVVRKPKENSQ